MIKYYKFRAINGKSMSKEVADGSRGGLGRTQKVENGLEAGYFLLFDLL